jgi:hypothetical protein
VLVFDEESGVKYRCCCNCCPFAGGRLEVMGGWEGTTHAICWNENCLVTNVESRVDHHGILRSSVHRGKVLLTVKCIYVDFE